MNILPIIFIVILISIIVIISFDILTNHTILKLFGILKTSESFQTVQNLDKYIRHCKNKIGVIDSLLTSLYQFHIKSYTSAFSNIYNKELKLYSQINSSKLGKYLNKNIDKSYKSDNVLLLLISHIQFLKYDNIKKLKNNKTVYELFTYINQRLKQFIYFLVDPTSRIPNDDKQAFKNYLIQILQQIGKYIIGLNYGVDDSILSKLSFDKTINNLNQSLYNSRRLRFYDIPNYYNMLNVVGDLNLFDRYVWNVYLMNFRNNKLFKNSISETFYSKSSFEFPFKNQFEEIKTDSTYLREELSFINSEEIKLYQKFYNFGLSNSVQNIKSDDVVKFEDYTKKINDNLKYIRQNKTKLTEIDKKLTENVKMLKEGNKLIDEVEKVKNDEGIKISSVGRIGKGVSRLNNNNINGNIVFDSKGNITELTDITNINLSNYNNIEFYLYGYYETKNFPHFEKDTYIVFLNKNAALGLIDNIDNKTINKYKAIICIYENKIFYFTTDLFKNKGSITIYDNNIIQFKDIGETVYYFVFDGTNEITINDEKAYKSYFFIHLNSKDNKPYEREFNESIKASVSIKVKNNKLEVKVNEVKEKDNKKFEESLNDKIVDVSEINKIDGVGKTVNEPINGMMILDNSEINKAVNVSIFDKLKVDKTIENKIKLNGINLDLICLFNVFNEAYRTSYVGRDILGSNNTLKHILMSCLCAYKDVLNIDSSKKISEDLLKWRLWYCCNKEMKDKKIIDEYYKVIDNIFKNKDGIIVMFGNYYE